jgi:hypothetical protein
VRHFGLGTPGGRRVRYFTVAEEIDSEGPSSSQRTGKRPRRFRERLRTGTAEGDERSREAATTRRPHTSVQTSPNRHSILWGKFGGYDGMSPD